ncbi:MAG: tyrosine-type recombinase/integrase [Acidimicrobiales bacterium]|jgi:integrase
MEARPRRRPGDQGIDRSFDRSIQGSPTAPIVFLQPDRTQLTAIVDEFVNRYTAPKTRVDLTNTLHQLFRYTGRKHPCELTENDLLDWARHNNPANNTVYSRQSRARTFTKWCLRKGYVITDVGEHLRDPDSPLRTFQRTYGKAQAKNPGRWLTHDEAYGQLLGVCQDGTDIGLRDELAIRLGLMGMRLAEIQHLTMSNLRQLPVITWTGKGRKPRRVTTGTAFTTVVERYFSLYAQHIGQPTDDMPVICRQLSGARRRGAPGRIDWTHPAGADAIFDIVTNRAAQAGLGHVAPHDLRRTAAGILHRATDEHGAHHFDLLDIQKVLGHSDPATTMRSYLEPMQTEILDRAALFLD